MDMRTIYIGIRKPYKTLNEFSYPENDLEDDFLWNYDQLQLKNFAMTVYD